MAIATKNVLVKTYWSIGLVERYYTVLRKIFKFIADNLQEYWLDKKMLLQMIVKAINNTTGLNSSIFILPVFQAYLHISQFDTLILKIT